MEKRWGKRSQTKSWYSERNKIRWRWQYYNEREKREWNCVENKKSKKKDCIDESASEWVGKVHIRRKGWQQQQRDRKGAVQDEWKKSAIVWEASMKSENENGTAPNKMIWWQTMHSHLTEAVDVVFFPHFFFPLSHSLVWYVHKCVCYSFKIHFITRSKILLLV